MPVDMTAGDAPGEVLFLVDCARCARWYGIWQPPPEYALWDRWPWLCASCSPIVAAARPPLTRGVLCRHVDYQHGPFADLLVLVVDGDWVTVQALGHPGRGGIDGRTQYHRNELITRTRI